MAEPLLKFVYNKSASDTPYNFYGANPDWGEIAPGVDAVVFTGGGIDDPDKAMGSNTLTAGTRSATIRPSVTSFVIPYTYVESGASMYRVVGAGHNTNRYVFGVSVSGSMNSELYLEAWDDVTFSTTHSPVLSGSVNSSNKSYVNAIRTTTASPPWHPGWSGNDTSLGAAFLRGSSANYRVGLSGLSAITNSVLYFNIYIRLETDSITFHETPVFGFRYLYT
jgi:hypothetical protein